MAGFNVPGVAGLRIPGVTPRAFCFVARKTELVMPGAGGVSDRFTYDVSLAADAGQASGYCVRKRVPTAESLVARLTRKHPELDPKDAAVRAAKLVDEVLPVFLTREAKALQLLQKKLPAAFRERVPRALRVEQNEAGFVTRLDMTWLRNGGATVTQLEFARQSAELLAALHEEAGIMHLDLRPDNMVVSDGRVGFIDFGSSAGVNEDLSKNPLLRQLFTQMTRTSQVHRVLNQLMEQGQITNAALRSVKGRADRGVDTFYLAVQVLRPHVNPEMERLIEWDPSGPAAEALATLNAAVLRPKSSHAAAYKTARDLLRGIGRIEAKLAG